MDKNKNKTGSLISEKNEQSAATDFPAAKITLLEVKEEFKEFIGRKSANRGTTEIRSLWT